MYMYLLLPVGERTALVAVIKQALSKAIYFSFLVLPLAALLKNGKCWLIDDFRGHAPMPPYGGYSSERGKLLL